MKTPFADFRAIKDRISIEQVLAHYGINWLRRNGDELRGRCPIHKGEGERAFHANVVKNIFHCFSGVCGAKGNVLDFVVAMEGVSVRDAALKLQEWFGIRGREQGSGRSPAPKGKPTEKPKEAVVVNAPLTFTLQNIDHKHPYLTERGISVETAQLFGAGYFPGKGSMAGRVVIPIHSVEGELLAYAGRSLDNSEPKYKLPAGFKKSLVLFNLHRVIKEPTPKTVVVVEGFFDCMKVMQAGYPCVALMGSALSQEQEELLCGHFRHCVLLFDGDDAGRAVTEDCVKRVSRRMFVKAIFLAEGKQPDMLVQGRNLKAHQRRHRMSRTIKLEVDDSVYALLEVLTRGEYGPLSVQDVIMKLIDHAQQGVYRPGAWERDWLCQAFGNDRIKHLRER